MVGRAQAGLASSSPTSTLAKLGISKGNRPIRVNHATLYKTVNAGMRPINRALLNPVFHGIDMDSGRYSQLKSHGDDRGFAQPAGRLKLRPVVMLSAR